jgi:putative SOS response-associated peptidase YedK
MRWGLKVPWETGAFINAKSETLTTLKLYHLHLNQRCLLLADGFHEGGALFYQPGKTVFCLAGLWREESGVRRFTMLTTSPNESVISFHDRMPFIAKSEQYDLWLGKEWKEVLPSPDHAPLGIFQNQPELF